MNQPEESCQTKLFLSERRKPQKWQPLYCIFKKHLDFDSLHPTGNSLVDTGLSLSCGSVGKFQLRRVKQGQRPLRHLTPLKWQRSEHNPLSSIREVYIHTRIHTLTALQWCVVTLTIKFHYSDASFIHNASYKLPRENAVSYAYASQQKRRLGADLVVLYFYKPTLISLTASILLS